MASLTPRLDRLDKNLIINGNFDYWQRGTSFSSAVYTADRFIANLVSGTIGVIRSTDVPNENSLFSLKLTGTSATNAQIQQRIESVYSRRVAGKKVTLSVFVKVEDSTGFPITTLLRFPTTKDTFSAFSAAVPSAVLSSTPVVGEWVRYTCTFELPLEAVNGIHIQIARAGTGNTVTYFSQVTLVEGEYNEVDFCYASDNSSDELLLCQRYYWKSFPLDTPPASNTGITGAMFSIAASTNGRVFVNAKNPSLMRVGPNITTYCPNAAGNGWTANPAAPVFEGAFSAQNTIYVYSTAANTIVGNGYYIHITADAEL